MEDFPDALAVLSAMITPAALISACGSLILATSDRLSKAVTRTREVSDQLRQRLGEAGSPEREEERRILFTLLYAAIILIRESRFALAAVNAEMDFVWTRGKALGPEDLVQKGIKRLRWFGGVK